MPKNYYVILGVESCATQDEIKSAYRDKVKKFHPDHYGADSGPFREVQEAYEVLGDPERRRQYDAEEEQQPRIRRRTQSVRPQRGWPTASPANPFSIFEEMSRLDELFFGRPFARRTASFEDVIAQLVGDYLGMHSRRTAPRDRIDVEIELTPEEARRGGRIRVGLPVDYACRRCNGQGHIGVYRCPDCLGTGSVSDELPLWLRIPPNIPDGYGLRAHLDHVGLPHVELNARFRIA
jgi:DnaJ-class molecular chaperone